MSDVPKPNVQGFLTDDDVEAIFESEKVFADELESQTLARLDWMLAKHEATLLIYASELGVAPETIAKLVKALIVMNREVSYFLSIGLDADHVLPPLHHPMQEVTDDLVTGYMEPEGFEHAVETLGPVSDRVAEILYGSHEDMVHALGQLQRRSTDG